MRALLVTLLAGSLAAEVIPTIELSWDGSSRPALVEPVAGWWQAALGEAADWWSDPAVATRDAAAAIASCGGLRLVGVGVAGGASGPSPWAAGWWQHPSPALIAGVRRHLADWPGYTVAEDRGRLRVDAPGVVVAPADPPPPGWRAVIHGDAILASVEAIAGDGDDLTPWRPALSHLHGWRLSATIEADWRGWIDAHLPARWFTAPDRELVARLPRDAAGRAVIAIDGAALVKDLAALVDPLPDELAAGLVAAKTDLAGVGQALTGTWALAMTAPGQGLACIPRSPLVDRLAQRWADQHSAQAPAEGGVLDFGDDLHLGCAARWWLIAHRREAITAFLAAPGARVDDPPSPAWAELSGAAAATLLADLPAEAAAQWPLPQALIGAGDQALRVATQLGLPVDAGRWRQALPALAGAGDHRLALRMVGDQARIELGGPLLPWVVPGLALRWFTDQVQDLDGRAKLRRHLAARLAAGQGALPADLVNLVPAATAERIAAAQALFRALPRSRPKPPSGADFKKQARTAYVPVPPPDEWWMTAAKALVAASAVIGADDFPAGSTVVVRDALAHDTLGPAMEFPHFTAVRFLAQTGRDLALFGDGDGVTLAERATRLMRDPLFAIDQLVAFNIRTLRDDAWLAAGLTHAVTPARLDAWAAEATPLPGGRCWQGERLFDGIAALGWLQRAPAPVSERSIRLLWAPAIWQPHVVRGATASDLVALDQLYLHWQDRTQALPAAWRMPVSPMSLMVLPGLDQVFAAERKIIARHILIRLAWRLHQSGRLQDLPVDAPAAATAVGVLSVPYGEALLPLTYSRRGAGFRLAVDASGERPAAIDAATWTRWKNLVPAPAEVRLAFPGPDLEIVIDPTPPAPAGGDPKALF